MTRKSEALTVSETAYEQAIVAALYICDECRWPSLGMAEISTRLLSRNEVGAALDENGHIAWLPQFGQGRDFPDVPDETASAASEAYKCLSIGADRGAASLARAVVEAVAKDRGITKGRLVEKIDAMEEQRIVRPGVAEAAHEVRHLGNDMAHGDFAEPVAHADAELVLELMATILEEIYVIPARVQSQRKRREAARGRASR